MSDLTDLFHQLLILRRTVQRNISRFYSQFTLPISIVNKLISILAYLGALACLCGLVVYIGFDHSKSDFIFLNRILRGVQIIFLFNIVFNLIFNFRKIIKNSRPIKWFADIAILVSAIPMLSAHTIEPWTPVLERIFYSNKFLFPVLAFYSVLTISYGIIRILGKRTNPSLILSCSFLFFIAIGTLLLMLPKCTYNGIGFVDSLFVSTSAVCITGLTSVDIPGTFTPFGIIVLSILIQTGGLGVMTFTSFFALFFSGNTSIYSQLLVKDMIYTRSINSLLPSLLYILGFTLVIEAIGAVCMFFAIHGLTDMTLNDEIIFSAFHSLSAFSNAGFSNIEGGFSNPALLHIQSQGVYIVASILIFLGGIGFPILVNFKEAFTNYITRFWNTVTSSKSKKQRIHIYDMNTKVVLATSLIIMVISSTLFFIFEYNNSFAGMSLYEKCVQSVFTSFVPRSSGFSSVNPAGFMNITLILLVVLMWIGGASQSTAGGIKVNTLATMFFNLRAIITGRERVTAFGRTISAGSITRANAIIAISIISFIFYSMLLIGMEPELGTKQLLYESASALFTVGASLGVTPYLSSASKILLCTAMLLGRVGILSILIGFYSGKTEKEPTYPSENIIIN